MLATHMCRSQCWVLKLVSQGQLDYDGYNARSFSKIKSALCFLLSASHAKQEIFKDQKYLFQQFATKEGFYQLHGVLASYGPSSYTLILS